MGHNTDAHARLASWMTAVTFMLAQTASPAQLYVGAGSSVTVGVGSSVAVLGDDITVGDGAALHNHALVVTDGDVLIQGTLRTTLRTDVPVEGFGQIRAAGQVIIDGNLEVEEAAVTDFRGAVDFPIILHHLGRAGVFWGEALPDTTYRVLYNPDAVVAHLGEHREEAASAKTHVARTPLTLYPNPVWGEEVVVSGLSADQVPRHVYLTDVTGRRHDTSAEPFGDQIRVAISARLASGMYLLEIVQSDGTRETLPFVVGRE